MIPILGRLSCLDTSFEASAFVLLGVSAVPMLFCLILGRWKKCRRFSLGRMIFLMLLATLFAAATKVLSENFDTSLREEFNDPEAIAIPWYMGAMLSVLWAMNAHVLFSTHHMDPKQRCPRLRANLYAIADWIIVASIAAFCLVSSVGFLYLLQITKIMGQTK